MGIIEKIKNFFYVHDSAKKDGETYRRIGRPVELGGVLQANNNLECDHRFKGEDVTNLNTDPVCIHCKKSASVIMAKHGVLMRFHWINESECTFLDVVQKSDQP